MRTEATLHDRPTPTATLAAGKPGVRLRCAVGLDVDLNYCVATVQRGPGPIRPAQKWTRRRFLKWVKEASAVSRR